MKRAVIAMMAVLTIANAYGCEPATELLPKLRSGPFSSYVQGDAKLEGLGRLTRASDPVCIYGLTLTMPNQHGATRLLVTNLVGDLHASYLLTLGEFVGLKGTTVLVKDSHGQTESIDLGETGLPVKVFFDGELSELFLPN